MSSTSSHAPFTVFIQDHLLTIQRSEGRGVRTLCTLDLRRQPAFYLSDAGVVCSDQHGNIFTVGTGENGDSDPLLAALSDAQRAQSEKFGRRWAIRGATAVLLLWMGFLLGSGVMFLRDSSSPRVSDPVLWSPQPVSPSVQRSPIDRPIHYQNVEPALSSVDQERAVTPVPADGWSLPVSIRATLPQKLKAAADRQLFTVNLSSGHDQTLYVFADPQCPNCQHLEPALVTAAQSANVVVFPVAVIGREKSIAAITPVLCLPPEQRPGAWQALLTVGHDGLQLGKPAAEGEAVARHCEVAEKALGVNEVAYQTYRIPGTPWVITDDGRHVPQSVLRDPTRLRQFLNKKETRDAAH